MMTKNEYIRLTNLTKLQIANRILRDVLPGPDYGVSQEERASIVSLVGAAEDILRAKCKIRPGRAV